jgi:hypothetical protein
MRRGLISASEASVPSKAAKRTEAEGQGPGLVGQKARPGMDVLLEDRLRVFGGDFLDLDAPLGRGHDDRGLPGPVDDDAEVEFAPDVERLLDKKAFDPLALRPRLVSDQGHADHVPGQAFGLFGRGGQLDPAPFAPAARVDLGLDHHAGTEPLRNGPGRFGGFGDLAARNPDAVAGQDLLGLKLVNLHGAHPY